LRASTRPYHSKKSFLSFIFKIASLATARLGRRGNLLAALALTLSSQLAWLLEEWLFAPREFIYLSL
jgi:hypothetical protein